MTSTTRNGRIEARFAALRSEGRAALVTFTMAGDPDAERAAQLATALPAAGADIIELGMPFSDPMADGPVIQRAGQRALAAGQTMGKTLDTVREIRAADNSTPVILMGYANPILAFGIQEFASQASEAGVDGLIVVDLPPEEDAELRTAADSSNLRLIRLVAPTTGNSRLPGVLSGSSGFVYYVSITGITGGAAPDSQEVAAAVARVSAATDLPVCVGFGVRTPEHAAEIARSADGVVVGSAICDRIGRGQANAEVLAYVRSLAEGVREARTGTP